jgi:hypothetical protein
VDLIVAFIDLPNRLSRTVDVGPAAGESARSRDFLHPFDLKIALCYNLLNGALH